MMSVGSGSGTVVLLDELLLDEAPDGEPLPDDPLPDELPDEEPLSDEPLPGGVSPDPLDPLPAAVDTVPAEPLPLPLGGVIIEPTDALPLGTLGIVSERLSDVILGIGVVDVPVETPIGGMTVLPL